jgi:hypothetical protein
MIYNIEATSTHSGAFASDPDEEYVRRYSLPRKAIACGSDLRRLTMREMMGAFVSLRARHYRDTVQFEPADRDYALSRVLFPKYRSAYIASMIPTLTRGKWLFDPGELGHPNSLFADLAPMLTRDYFQPASPPTTGVVPQSPALPDIIIRPPEVYLMQVPASSVSFG